ncbi:MAG: rRNA maturation RNase YbeY [Phycisphaerales bacterium]|nr:rRNA maturation RNase YbeY [Phycisphaerales bacterium]
MPDDRNVYALSCNAPQARAGVDVEVCLDDHAGLSVAEREALGRLATLAVGASGAVGGGEVRVKIVGDAEMAEAHVRYSGVEGTTDVLTFDLAEGASARGGALDVDILVCADEARRQALEHGHDPVREMLLYVLHGVLHCLGHDDHTDDGFARMHAEEDRILAKIGVGATFKKLGVDGGGER